MGFWFRHEKTPDEQLAADIRSLAHELNQKLADLRHRGYSVGVVMKKYSFSSEVETCHSIHKIDISQTTSTKL